MDPQGERFVIRHRLDADTWRRLLPALRLRLETDLRLGADGRGRVATLYLDTPDLAAARAAERLREPRRRVRLRLLETAGRAPRGVVEVGHRVGLRVLDWQAELPISALGLPPGAAWTPARPSVVVDEAVQLMRSEGLAPSCLVRRDRQAFVGGLDEPGFEVHLDSFVRYRLHDLELRPDDTGVDRPLLSEDERLLTVRHRCAVPHWLTLMLGRAGAERVPDPQALAMRDATARDERRRESGPARA